MLTVACVLRSGGDFDPSWVDALERSCFERIKEPHRFCCLTDYDIPASDIREKHWIDWLPLKHGWPGWWSKIELFRPGLFLADNPVLYFDLDTIIARDIGHFAGTIDCDLVLLRDFYRLDTGWGTGLMGWTGGQLEQIYKTFKADAKTFIAKYRSDQDFIKMLVPPSWIRFWQDEYPGHVVSYKIHCDRGLPGNAHVICFHGKPRPTEVGGWVKEKWGKR